MELHGRDVERGREECPVLRNKGKGISLRDEDWVRRAVEASGDVGAEIIDRACEVCAAHENVGEEESHQDCADPCSNEA